ncbi:MAG: ABC transporter ATP-binding protein [Actinobacteria bacterium]|nr:ABC transporter ATP-binding protein [Actinomycetota bacterium]
MTEPDRRAELGAGLRLIARTLRSYPATAAIAIAGALIWMASVVAIPYVIGLVIDDAILGDDRTLLVALVGVLLVIGVIQAIGIGVRRYHGFKLSYRAEADLRNRMFTHIQRLAFSFHDETPTGQLMSRASSDLSQVRLIFALMPIVLANLVMFLVVMIVLVIIDPVLGAVASLTVPALALTSNRYAGKVIDLSFRIQERLADLAQVVEESVAGIEVVKAYGQEKRLERSLRETAVGIYDNTITVARHRAAFAPLFEMIPAFGTVAVLWLGGFRVIDGELSPGEFVAFTQYLAMLVLPLMITGWFFANLPRAAAAGARIVELLAEAPEIDDPARPIALPSGPGEVRFDGVWFSYPNGEPVLRGMDLVVPGGATMAIVGATGSGKSTIAELVPRFYDVDSGSITIDGVEIRDVSLDELRGEVAVVFQETFLFSASIRDNLRVGDPSADDRAIRTAARLAQAHDFISALPEGYDTVVGERGATLSGGQRQRVALARSVLRDPGVFILDDATSSVDAVVEADIQAAMRRVMQDRTTIIIAHRTSTLALADLVAFLEGGVVVAVGTHEELLESVPRYAQVLASGEPAGAEVPA